MPNNVPFNNEFVNRLLSIDYKNGGFKELRKILAEFANTNSRKHINPHIFLNRKTELKKIIDFYSDESQKLLLVGGFQGVGKTALIRTSLLAFNPEVFIFFFECSTITNLDDILLNFCGFFDRKYRFDNTSKVNMSIDVRLLTYLKKLDKYLIVVLDNIEHLVSSKNTIENEDLKHFLNFLHTHPKIKLVLSGQKLPSEDIDLTIDFISQLRIIGLDESDSIMFFKNTNFIGNDKDLAEIYKISRGYPWLLNLSVKLFLLGNIHSSQILSDFYQYENTYEAFIIGKICSKLSNAENMILKYLSTFRHPVNIEVLNSILNDNTNIQAIIEHLYKYGLIKSSYSRYYLNNTVRKINYDSISTSEKFELHTKISNFYASENNKRLAERILKLSRNLLHSEQIFHNLLASKLLPDKEKIDLKQKILANYYAPGVKDYYGQAQSINTPIEKEISSTAIDKISSSVNQKETKNLIEIEGISIRLNDEEKNLLDEVNNTDYLIYQEPSKHITSGSIIEMDWVKEVESNPVFDQPVDHDDSYKQSLLYDIIESLKFVAQTYAQEGKNELALERYKETIELCKQNNLEEELVKILIEVAAVYANLKQLDLALSNYQEAEKMLGNKDTKYELAIIKVNIAKIYLLNYQHDKALQLFDSVLKMPIDNLTNNIKGSALMGIAEVYDYRNQLNEALEFYSLAKEIFEQISDTNTLAIIHSRTGLIYDDLGEYQRAILEYEKSLDLDKELGNKQNYSSTLANLAAICDEIDDKQKAVRYYKKSIILDKELNNLEGLYKTLSRLGTIYSEVEEIEKAHKYYQEELKISKKIKDPYLIAMAYIDIGDLYYFVKDYTKAAKCFLLSEKLISNTISTDSKEKILKRISKLKQYISTEKFQNIKKQIFQGNNDD